MGAVSDSWLEYVSTERCIRAGPRWGDSYRAPAGSVERDPDIDRRQQPVSGNPPRDKDTKA